MKTIRLKDINRNQYKIKFAYKWCINEKNYYIVENVYFKTEGVNGTSYSNLIPLKENNSYNGVFDFHQFEKNAAYHLAFYSNELFIEIDGNKYQIII